MSTVADLLDAYEIGIRQIASAVVVLVLAAGAGYLALRSPRPAPESVLPMAADVADPSTVTSGVPAPAEPEVVVVHIAGAVEAPGVRTLDGGARVADAIAAADGPSSEADLDRVNLAAVVVDGQRIYVPVVGEVVDTDLLDEDPLAGGPSSGPVDLNRASESQLESLPGVGPATAVAIVEHRSRTGGFVTVDDLLDVRGIGPSKFEQLRTLVTV